MVKNQRREKNGIKLEEPHGEGIDEKCHHVHKDDNFEEGSLCVDTVTRDLSTANGEDEEQVRLEEACIEQIGTTCHNKPEEYKTVQVLQLAGSMREDLSAANGEYQEQQIDNNTGTKPELLANDHQPEKKSKKKMKQTQGASDLTMSVSELKANQETTLLNFEDQPTNTVPLQKRTLSNGLIIEELASGPPGGKVAAPGKKVKIYYTGMLKETEHVFDSNVGKTAFKFRLGDDEFIDGWNVGIEAITIILQYDMPDNIAVLSGFVLTFLLSNALDVLEEMRIKAKICEMGYEAKGPAEIYFEMQKFFSFLFFLLFPSIGIRFGVQVRIELEYW
ncbi:UNVERIFIED_CONTAM: Peptidyl-prolyl cis-trans isomerase FKBP43 [Sesamum angustifolium]|uniref:peptidylprolyl isomerase n=1 Tax=Sesamum angustifolium TaxID=2727405 RepID=A0AAW2RIL7_9LAMI